MSNESKGVRVSLALSGTSVRAYFDLYPDDAPGFWSARSPRAIVRAIDLARKSGR